MIIMILICKFFHDTTPHESRWSLYREICITKAMQLMWRWSPATRNTRCTAHRDSDLSFHKRFGSHDHQFVHSPKITILKPKIVQQVLSCHPL